MGPGRRVIGGADSLLSFLDGVGGGGRCGLGVNCSGRKGLHVGKSAVSENFSSILGEVDRRDVEQKIGEGALSEPQVLGIGGAVWSSSGKWFYLFLHALLVFTSFSCVFLHVFARFNTFWSKEWSPVVFGYFSNICNWESRSHVTSQEPPFVSESPGQYMPI